MAEFILMTGRPGNGKTIFVVSKILTEKVRKNYFVFHNIDGFQENAVLKQRLLNEDYCIDWVDYCEKRSMEPLEFFSKEYQVKLSEEVKKKHDRKMLIVIDEMHDYFLRYNRETLSWLTYYRHLDQDVYGMTQARNQLHYLYRNSLKMEYLAKFSVGPIIMYNKMFEKMSNGYFFFIKKQRYFDAYKSAMSHTKPTKNYYPAMILGVVIIGLIVFLSGALLPKKFKVKTKNNNDVEKNVLAVNEAHATVARESDNEEVEDKIINDDYCYHGQAGGRYILSDQDGNYYYLDEILPWYKVVGVTGRRLVALNMRSSEIELIIYRKLKTMDSARALD